MRDLFRSSAFNQPIGNWDTSKVTDMSLFQTAKVFNQDISNWDTAEVTNMSRMFNSAEAFNGNIAGWNTSKVTKMGSMFIWAKSFNQDISAWDVTAVTSMSNMFNVGMSNANKGLVHAAFSTNENWNMGWSEFAPQAPALNDETFSTALALWFSDEAAAIETYGHIRNWNTSAVTNMREAFKDKVEFNENISDWDTSSVTNMSKMFNNAKAFNQPIGKWDTSSLKSVNYIFANAEKFNQPLANWDVSQVSHMTAMFYNASEFDPEHQRMGHVQPPEYGPNVLWGDCFQSAHWRLEYFQSYHHGEHL